MDLLQCEQERNLPFGDESKNDEGPIKTCLLPGGQQPS